MLKNRIYSVAMGLLAILFGSCSPLKNVETVDANAFETAITADTVQLVDVRTAAEYAGAHIENAINIDVNQKDFMDVAEKSLDKEKKVYVYCRSGARSMKAAGQLANAGYQVVNLDGGITAWLAQGKPVTKAN